MNGTKQQQQQQLNKSASLKSTTNERLTKFEINENENGNEMEWDIIWKLETVLVAVHPYAAAVYRIRIVRIRIRIRA